MNRTRALGAICVCLAAVAGTLDDAVSQEIPRYSTPQDMPCSDQPRSIEELVAAFDRGHMPEPSQVNGTWVAIGLVDDSPRLNCTGVTRGKVFEWVMLADHYSIEIDMIGMFLQTTRMTPDDQQSVTLLVDFGGDSMWEYRCRLTDRGTLACLYGRGDWIRGVEFKMMPVTDDQRAHRRQSR